MDATEKLGEAYFRTLSIASIDYLLHRIPKDRIDPARLAPLLQAAATRIGEDFDDAKKAVEAFHGDGRVATATFFAGAKLAGIDAAKKYLAEVSA